MPGDLIRFECALWCYATFVRDEAQGSHPQVIGTTSETHRKDQLSDILWAPWLNMRRTTKVGQGANHTMPAKMLTYRFFVLRA